MAKGPVIEFTDDNFDSEVLRSDVPTLVDFWAAWCGPCRQIAPFVDALAAEYEGRIKIGKMDIDSNQITPGKYNVRAIPTLLVFKDGKVVGHIQGVVPKSKIEAELTQHL